MMFILLKRIKMGFIKIANGLVPNIALYHSFLKILDFCGTISLISESYIWNREFRFLFMEILSIMGRDFQWRNGKQLAIIMCVIGRNTLINGVCVKERLFMLNMSRISAIN